VVDSIAVQTAENMILNADRKPFNARDLVIERSDNRFAVRSVTNETINFLNIKFTSYENMVVLDNLSIFADLIYQPITGARQDRVKLIGTTTTEWNGQLNAQGFVLNQDNIKPWSQNVKYARGEIVEYKNFYYSAIDIVQPSAKFDFNEWTISDYTKIQQGLLPNLANKSNQLANSYNTYTANLEQNQDLFSYGLIGFKPRQYMVSLNLDSTSQVNLYQQFIKTKGTTQATDLFTQVNFDPLTAQYRIYENWGILAGTYGANANRSWFEITLDEELLTGNPSTVQIIQPGQASQANQGSRKTEAPHTKTLGLRLSLISIRLLTGTDSHQVVCTLQKLHRHWQSLLELNKGEVIEEDRLPLAQHHRRQQQGITQILTGQTRQEIGSGE
jgi:hypothetical protein